MTTHNAAERSEIPPTFLMTGLLETGKRGGERGRTGNLFLIQISGLGDYIHELRLRTTWHQKALQHNQIPD